MRASKVLASAALLVLALGIPNTSTADDPAGPNAHYDHGAVCQPVYGDYTKLQYGEPGAGNFSTSAVADVFCPVSRPPSSYNWSAFYAATKAKAYYEDNSSTDSVRCYAWGKDAEGAGYYTSWLYSCPTAGGCTTNSSPSHTGVGYLLWTSPNTLWEGCTSLSTVEFMGYHCVVPQKATFASWARGFWTEWDACIY